MKCVIIEDENHAVERLESLLAKLEPSAEVVARIASVEKAVEWLRVNSCDLIFLDVHLGDDSSFSIFKQVQVDAFVIFTTAYDEYAMEAFTLNSIDYLLKPIMENAFKAAMDKYHLLQKKMLPDYSKLGVPRANYQKRFLVHKGDALQPLLTDNIAYFTLQGRFLFIITRDKGQYVYDSTLDLIEQKLDPEQFFRLNRQFIVNFDVITQLYNTDKGRIGIKTDPSYKEEILVSIKKVTAFKSWLDR